MRPYAQSLSLPYLFPRIFFSRLSFCESEPSNGNDTKDQ